MAKLSLGFKVGKNHGYLGHFAQDKFIRAGHNTVAPRPPGTLVRVNDNPTQAPNAVPRVDVMGGPQVSTVFPAPPSTSAVAPGFQAPKAPIVPSTPVPPSAPAPAFRTTPNQLSARNARRAIRHVLPGALSVTGANAARGASVAAERPVIAARLAAKQAGITGTARRQMVSAARLDPNSRQSERLARRGVTRTRIL